MSLRSDLADALAAELPAGYYTVMPYTRALDGASGPVVMVNRRRIAVVPDRHGAIEHDVELTVLVPETYGAGAEDAADEAIEDVIRVVERISDPVVWTEATRSLYEGNFVGWSLVLTFTTQNYLQETQP